MKKEVILAEIMTLICEKPYSQFQLERIKFLAVMYVAHDILAFCEAYRNKFVRTPADDL